MLNASVDLLDHLGLDHHAQLIESAITKTINVDKIWTPGKQQYNTFAYYYSVYGLFPDLHGQATSIDVVQNVIRNIQLETKEKNW